MSDRIVPLDGFDWEHFSPKDRATLLFVFRGMGQEREVLLIRKKRGLGAGKVNAPGGKLEGAETPLAAALRECEEEVGLQVEKAKRAGELSFQFEDGYSLHCTVFTAEEYEGKAVETDEAIPFWVPIEDIPYDEMWADDHLWIPRLLAGEAFQGFFFFRGDELLSEDLRCC
ncbi:MAG: 8-oxo-dGTP diphosphatase [Polyangiaceae bacterium]|nr:8-oxo-dGTP diphosphatase [Polyangiaceae bacterium]